MTIHFMDGTKVSFNFPEQKTNDAARAIMIEEMRKSPYLIVEAEGVFMVYPVHNIKSIQIQAPAGKKSGLGTKAVIHGARVVD
jgi:hypothetical protein